MLSLVLILIIGKGLSTLSDWLEDRPQAAEGSMGVPADRIISAKHRAWSHLALPDGKSVIAGGFGNEEVRVVHYVDGEKLVGRLPGKAGDFIYWQGKVLATGLFPGVVELDGSPWKEGSRFKDMTDLSLESDGTSLLVIRSQQGELHLLKDGVWKDLSPRLNGMLPEESRVFGDTVALSHKSLLRVGRKGDWQDQQRQGIIMSKAILPEGRIITLECDILRQTGQPDYMKPGSPHRVYLVAEDGESRLIATFNVNLAEAFSCAGGAVIHLVTEQMTHRLLFIAPDGSMKNITPRDARGTYFVSVSEDRVSVLADDKIHLVNPRHPDAKPYLDGAGIK